VAAKLTVRAWLNQPPKSAGREAVALACGAVASYLRRKEGLAALPARSRQVPLTDVEALSGPA
jgi:hypothetical protein